MRGVEDDGECIPHRGGLLLRNDPATPLPHTTYGYYGDFYGATTMEIYHNDLADTNSGVQAAIQNWELIQPVLEQAGPSSFPANSQPDLFGSTTNPCP